MQGNKLILKAKANFSPIFYWQFLLMLSCIVGICISGCGELNCILSVVSSYSGCGEDGQDLESGLFTNTFTFSAGDVFYEWNDGQWNRKNNKNYNAEIIILITKIDDNGVTILIDVEKLYWHIILSKTLNQNMLYVMGVTTNTVFVLQKNKRQLQIYQSFP
jgi:hypothetical protein